MADQCFAGHASRPLRASEAASLRQAVEDALTALREAQASIEDDERGRAALVAELKATPIQGSESEVTAEGRKGHSYPRTFWLRPCLVAAEALESFGFSGEAEGIRKQCGRVKEASTMVTWDELPALREANTKAVEVSLGVFGVLADQLDKVISGQLTVMVESGPAASTREPASGEGAVGAGSEEQAGPAGGQERGPYKTDNDPQTAREMQSMAKLAKAMMIVREHPDWSNRFIAKQAGYKSHSPLVRNKTYRTAAAMARERKKDLPRGTKDGETGDVEAWEDGDEED